MTSWRGPEPEFLPVDLSHLPGVKVVWWNVWDSRDPVWTDEDMAFIHVTDRVDIDVGFYRDGRFSVWVVQDNDWEDLVEEARTDDPRELPAIVKRLAEKYVQA